MGRTSKILGAASFVLNICLVVVLLLQREHNQELDGQLIVLRSSVNDQVLRSSVNDQNGRSPTKQLQVAASTTELLDEKRKVDQGWTGRTPDEVLLSDPHYRSLRLKGEKGTLYRVHAEAITAIHLSPDTTEDLLTLLAEHALQFVEPPSGKPREDVESRWRIERQLNEQRQQAEIEALIGTQKYREWRKFYETKSARYEVALLEGQVEAIGEPLRSDQRETLVDMIADEEQQQPVRDILGPGVRENRLSTLESDAKRIEASNERLRQLAAGFLMPKQLEVFETSLDRKLSWMRTRVDLERQYLKISQDQTS